MIRFPCRHYRRITFAVAVALLVLSPALQVQSVLHAAQNHAATESRVSGAQQVTGILLRAALAGQRKDQA